MSYTATAVRVGRFWEVTVPDIGVTQVTRLDQAEAMAADLIGAVLDVDPIRVDVTVTPAIDPAVSSQLEEAGQLRAQAATANAQASERIVRAATALKRQGLTVRDIGSVLGVSFQRAQQLINR